MKYYCYLEYYWGGTVGKNIKSDELKYHTGHSHGVMPTSAQWESRRVSLYASVRGVAATKKQTYPGDSTVLAGATQATRSES